MMKLLAKRRATRVTRAGSNFRKPVLGTTCHTQCVYGGCWNLL